MPTPLIKKIAADTKTQDAHIERLWNKAKRLVKSKYDYTEKDSSFWKLVTSITQKLAGIKEHHALLERSGTSFKDDNNLDLLIEAELELAQTFPIVIEKDLIIIDTKLLKKHIKFSALNSLNTRTLLFDGTSKYATSVELQEFKKEVIDAMTMWIEDEQSRVSTNALLSSIIDVRSINNKIEIEMLKTYDFVVN